MVCAAVLLAPLMPTLRPLPAAAHADKYYAKATDNGGDGWFLGVRNYRWDVNQS